MVVPYQDSYFVTSVYVLTLSSNSSLLRVLCVCVPCNRRPLVLAVPDVYPDACLESNFQVAGWNHSVSHW